LDRGKTPDGGTGCGIDEKGTMKSAEAKELFKKKGFELGEQEQIGLGWGWGPL